MLSSLFTSTLDADVTLAFTEACPTVERLISSRPPASRFPPLALTLLRVLARPDEGPKARTMTSLKRTTARTRGMRGERWERWMRIRSLATPIDRLWFPFPSDTLCTPYTSCSALLYSLDAQYYSSASLRPVFLPSPSPSLSLDLTLSTNVISPPSLVSSLFLLPPSSALPIGLACFCSSCCFSVSLVPLFSLLPFSSPLVELYRYFLHRMDSVSCRGRPMRFLNARSEGPSR
jgi:hypothetical protein